ncbi:hypothetical protein BX600DRAFT_534220 [Xylariales sp. PMI_506]|nr:hypothetical protein BX600DRAFT_534220 [Xylariales sp. PMI_506]
MDAPKDVAVVLKGYLVRAPDMACTSTLGILYGQIYQQFIGDLTNWPQGRDHLRVANGLVYQIKSLRGSGICQPHVWIVREIIFRNLVWRADALSGGEQYMLCRFLSRIVEIIKRIKDCAYEGGSDADILEPFETAVYSTAAAELDRMLKAGETFDKGKLTLIAYNHLAFMTVLQHNTDTVDRGIEVEQLKNKLSLAFQAAMEYGVEAIDTEGVPAMRHTQSLYRP